MKRKDGGNGRRQIWGVFLSFAAFYLCAMLLLTVFQALEKKKIMTEAARENASRLAAILRSAAENAAGEAVPIAEGELPYLHQALGSIRQDAMNSGIYLRAAVWEEEGRLLADTGNTLFFEDLSAVDGETGEVRRPMLRCVRLDEYMEPEEFAELMKGWGYGNTGGMQILGYDENGMITPVKIVLAQGIGIQQGVGSIPEGEVTGEMILENEGRGDPTVFQPVFGQVSLEWTSNRRLEDPVTRQRFDVCRDLEQTAREHWLDQTGTLGGEAKGGLLRTQLSGIGAVFGETILSYGLQFYPLEEAVKSLLPLYPLCLLPMLLAAGLLTRRLKAVEARRLRLEEERKRFTDAVAHELKNPLAVIRGYGEALRERIHPEKTGRYLEGIIRETDRLDGLVQDMLRLSRMEGGDFHPRPERFFLREWAESTASAVQGAAEEKQVRIRVLAGEQELIADRTAADFALSNFLSNAVRHVVPGGEIRISAEQLGAKTRVWVENDGPAIPPEQLPHLWERFYRGDEGRSRVDGGAGLGLAIAREYLEQAGAAGGCENIPGGVRFWMEWEKQEV